MCVDGKLKRSQFRTEIDEGKNSPSIRSVARWGENSSSPNEKSVSTIHCKFQEIVEERNSRGLDRELEE